MTDEPKPQQSFIFPRAPGETATFTAASGRTVSVTKRPEEDAYELRLPDDPTYAALLVREARDAFELRPAPGVLAIGGFGLAFQDLYDNF